MERLNPYSYQTPMRDEKITPENSPYLSWCVNCISYIKCEHNPKEDDLAGLCFEERER